MGTEQNGNSSDKLMNAVQQFLASSGLQNAQVTVDTKHGSAKITGTRENMRYTTSIQTNQHGVTNTISSYDANLGRQEKIKQVKQLRRQGFKQNEIADMLGISQASVSLYLKN